MYSDNIYSEKAFYEMKAMFFLTWIYFIIVAEIP